MIKVIEISITSAIQEAKGPISLISIYFIKDRFNSHDCEVVFWKL